KTVRIAVPGHTGCADVTAPVNASRASAYNPSCTAQRMSKSHTRSQRSVGRHDVRGTGGAPCCGSGSCGFASPPRSCGRRTTSPPPFDSPRSPPVEAGQPMHNAPDVLVIGGGPAGSVAATLLADAGHRVLVLERERFPRYHIGESLLSATLPILDAVGATPAIERHGFLRKPGGTFLWGRQRAPWSF